MNIRHNFNNVYEDTTKKIELLNEKMYANIQNICKNGANLEELEKKAENLNLQAQHFQLITCETKKKFQQTRKRIKLAVFVILLIFVVLLFILYIYINYLHIQIKAY